MMLAARAAVTAGPISVAAAAATRAPIRDGRPRVAHSLAELPIHAKLTVTQPGDPLEEEADRMAAKLVDAAGPPAQIPRVGPDTAHGHVGRQVELRKNEEEDSPEEDVPQRVAAKQLPGAAPLPLGLARPAPLLPGGGQALPLEVRGFFEPRFGRSLGHVRVHTDVPATETARSLQARAFTLGRDIAFAPGEYRPDTASGRLLLAHELVHVVQGERGDGARQGHVMRQRVQPQAPTAAEREDLTRSAIRYVDQLAEFVDTLRQEAAVLVRTPSGQQPTAAVRQRAQAALSPQRLRELLRKGRSTLAAQLGILTANDPAAGDFRRSFLRVVNAVRLAMPQALAVSNLQDAATQAADQVAQAELTAELIEASPVTSTGLAGTTVFRPGDVAAGADQEAMIEAYLDDLARSLPGQRLTPAQRDRIFERVLAGLRRAFVTVAASPSGALDVRAISNPRIVEKYRRVAGLLTAGLSAHTQPTVVTDPIPAYVLPDPIPDVTAQLRASPNVGTVDFSRVPRDELAAVRFGVRLTVDATFQGAPVRRRNASWPVAFQVRRPAGVVPVRYDLVFDAASNVSVERLGEAASREVPQAFARLSLADKKAALVAEFGLAALDDRPAAPGRPRAAWTSAELDQVKTAYDLIPARDRPSLRGVTLVRDHVGPALAAGRILLGFAHTEADPLHDVPGSPAHAAPHIHYYDAAFAQNAIAAVGAPGATGPGGDWTLAHEVGHMRIFLAHREATAAVRAANTQLTQAGAASGPLGASLPLPVHQIRQAYLTAEHAANLAIVAFNAAVVASPPAPAPQQAQLLQAAQAAVQARNQARTNLAAAAVPPAMVQAALRRDAANDALLSASQRVVAAQDQIPAFVALAGTFGFRPPTDFAGTGGDDFFAETYALFLTDPNRLNQMNRSIFLWFEAGMPMNRAWRPAP